ncbi:hypothetical protein D1872_233200 [compost metagenome]
MELIPSAVSAAVPADNSDVAEEAWPATNVTSATCDTFVPFSTALTVALPACVDDVKVAV